MKLNDYVVAIKEETFNKIKIYGFGMIIKSIEEYDEDYEVEYIIALDNGKEISSYICNNIVLASDWVEYVDSRCAKVIRCKV